MLPLKKNRSATFLEIGAHVSHERVAVAAHGLKACRLDKIGPKICRDRDAEEICHSLHLGREVRFQIVVVDQQDVRTMSGFPPASLEVQEGYTRRAILVTRHFALRDPLVKELARIGLNAWVGTPDGFILKPGFVQTLQRLVREARGMIVE